MSASARRSTRNNQAIEGLSPKQALAAGLKVDVDALPPDVVNQLLRGKINLDDPAVTLALLKLNAVLGVTGFINPNGTLKSIGLQCAICHSTVDNSLPQLCAGAIAPNPGTGCIGHRMDGWSNRDLNVGAIVALAPDLSSLAKLLSTTQATVRTAELILDGKAFNTQQVTDGVVTSTKVPGATLIPPAFGLEPAYMDRLGFNTALECVRGKSRAAWKRAIL